MIITFTEYEIIPVEILPNLTDIFTAESYLYVHE